MRLRRKPQPLEMAERRRRRPGQACPWRCGSRRTASRTPDTCRVLVRRNARRSHLRHVAYGVHRGQPHLPQDLCSLLPSATVTGARAAQVRKTVARLKVALHSLEKVEEIMG